MSKEIPEFISVPALSRRWNVSKSWVGNKCRDNMIPSKKLGNKWFISYQWVIDTEQEVSSEYKKTGLENS